MKENLEMAVFLFFVILAVTCGLWPITVSIHECWKEAQKEEEKGRGRFDERQRFVQARAGVHALAALVAYLIVWAALDVRGGHPWTDEVSPLVLTGLLLAHLIWTAECILKDAWSSWKDGRPALGGVAAITSLVVWQNMFWRRGGVWRAAYVFLCADIAVLFVLALYDERRRKREKSGGGGE